ncbi:DUF1016 N-terminal domain-containing protein [Thiorhodovibrio frisius]|uniref:DUF1016 N-terminal domain-containing protein n=1 Tax=Thiorhodovibrio frisius TaxID=631362 RepID=UPI00022C6BED|nr:DUF1016 N-terminal domain-containing protein [Thiorhodovibrio frisius]WPL22870.1 hypothetical protein Thiofri_03047 [Thiorhodovibrio frisius]
MITGELKSKVDRIWDTLWSGGISNPLSVIEQLTYLLFIKRLDELHTLSERKAARTGKPIEEPIFSPDQSALRWSRFKETAPETMFETVRDSVFPFIKTLGRNGGQANAAYGDQLIKELSKRLGDEFGKGFSIANLKNFRKFYLTFPELQKGYALRSQLSWSHYRLIMRVEEAEARDYYIREAADQGWSSRQLERNIRSGWHRRLPSTSSTASPPSPDQSSARKSACAPT